jgi:hypothetical protein
MINEGNKTNCVVIGGHRAGLMQSVFQLCRIIVCCELCDWFLQIPLGAGVAFVLRVYALENFVHAIEILVFYRILMMKDLILSPEPLSSVQRQFIFSVLNILPDIEYDIVTIYDF